MTQICKKLDMDTGWRCTKNQLWVPSIYKPGRLGDPSWLCYDCSPSLAVIKWLACYTQSKPQLLLQATPSMFVFLLFTFPTVLDISYIKLLFIQSDGTSENPSGGLIAEIYQCYRAFVSFSRINSKDTGSVCIHMLSQKLSSMGLGWAECIHRYSYKNCMESEPLLLKSETSSTWANKVWVILINGSSLCSQHFWHGVEI